MYQTVRTISNTLIYLVVDVALVTASSALLRFVRCDRYTVVTDWAFTD